MADVKAELSASLEGLNEAVLAKLDGLGEYDLRRPLTPTGTNLLGMVKHLASVQAGYFGDCFGRPWPDPMPWFSTEAEINADMYATAEQTSDWVRDFYRRSWAHAQQTFAVTELDDTGTVPWWPPERRHPTLSTALIHVIAETARHAGHLDIGRELIDGEIGRFAGDRSIPSDDEIDWPAYVDTVEAAARAASAGSVAGSASGSAPSPPPEGDGRPRADRPGNG
ncbi:MAG: DinB family protein [Acidimicrobiia bacterium]|nr:DinB family protein [Acidimicrobiia bacterium]